MKRIFNLKTVIAVLAAAAIFTSCSDDDGPKVNRKVIDFENTGIELAGPTSYGENCYAGYTGGTQFVSGQIAVEPGVYMKFGVNFSLWDDEDSFMAGGMILSQWNYRTNKVGETSADWWYSYKNQCSVYNTASTDGANSGAGANGSNTFALINGYDDPNSFSPAASFEFTSSAEYLVESIDICPNSYLYGVVTGGNDFGSTTAVSLINSKGWFKILAYGFDAAGNPTNGGNPVEKYVCDYRDEASPKIAIATVWQTWDLSALGKVNKVKFDFDGSDKNNYGLLTPTYMCVDNVSLILPDTEE